MVKILSAAHDIFWEFNTDFIWDLHHIPKTLSSSFSEIILALIDDDLPRFLRQLIIKLWVVLHHLDRLDNRGLLSSVHFSLDGLEPKLFTIKLGLLLLEDARRFHERKDAPPSSSRSSRSSGSSPGLLIDDVCSVLVR